MIAEDDIKQLIKEAAKRLQRKLDEALLEEISKPSTFYNQNFLSRCVRYDPHRQYNH